MAAVYFAAGRLALMLAIPPGYATAVWPAAGLALAGVLWRGPSVMPGILAGSFLVNIGTSLDSTNAWTILRSTLLAISVGGGAAWQANVGARLVRRYVGFPNSLAELPDVIRFLLLGGPVSCLVSASWGVLSLWSGGILAAENTLFNWFTWWVGDTIGAMIFAPLALIWLTGPRQGSARRRMALSLPLGVTFALAVALFIFASAADQNRILAEFRRRTEVLTHELQKD
jgi:integral membrane sensor domain MASE1